MGKEDDEKDCTLHLVPESEDEVHHVPYATCGCEPRLMKAIDEDEDGKTVVEAMIWIHSRAN